MALPISSDLSRAAARAHLAAILLLYVFMGTAQAAVLQLVNAGFTPGAFGTPASDTDQVFVAASDDVTTNIFASVGQTPPGGPGYLGTASAGTFGQVGLDARIFGVAPGSSLLTEVLIGSDEFVNVFGQAGNVTANFIIDGGFISDPFSTNSTVMFTVEVGAEHLGIAGPAEDALSMEVSTRLAAGLGGSGGFFPDFEGGRYVATYRADAASAPSFSASVEGGLDLRAEFDAAGRRVEIPFSLQSLDLGTLLPGERLLLAYRAEISIVQDGIAEGIFAGFSDPLGLSGSSILGALTFTPLVEPPPDGALPSPGTLMLLAAASLALLGNRRRNALPRVRRKTGDPLNTT